MSKTEKEKTIIEDLKNYTNNCFFINVSQLSRFIGITRERAAQLLFRLRYIPNGNEKLYYIVEVAELLMNQTVSEGAA